MYFIYFTKLKADLIRFDDIFVLLIFWGKVTVKLGPPSLK